MLMLNPFISMDEGDFIKVWKEDAVHCRKDIHFYSPYETQCLLFQDGQFIPKNFRECIYPFAKNPEKKIGFFSKKACRSAKIVWVATNCDHKVDWGIYKFALITDPNTGTTYTVGASGKLYFRIIDRPQEAYSFYRKLYMVDCNSAVIKQRLGDMVAHIFSDIFSARFVNGLQGRTGLTPSEKLSLSQELFERLQAIFVEYGMEILPQSKWNLIQNIIIQ